MRISARTAPVALTSLADHRAARRSRSEGRSARSHLLTDRLGEVAEIAGALCPYGIRTHLSVTFAAPLVLGGLATADPLDEWIGLSFTPARTEGESPDTCPDELLLFFHHVPYGHVLHSGRTVIQHIYDTHFEGVAEVEEDRRVWASLMDLVEPQYRHAERVEGVRLGPLSGQQVGGGGVGGQAGRGSPASREADQGRPAARGDMGLRVVDRRVPTGAVAPAKERARRDRLPEHGSRGPADVPAAASRHPIRGRPSTRSSRRAQ